MAFKQELMDALKDSVSYYNSGLSADAAIVKSAQEHEFNMDQTDRLVETFNTALTINKFTKASSDRTEEFGIANKDIVHRDMFHQNTGKNEEKKASYDYSFYDEEPINMNKHKVFFDALQKTAESFDTTDTSGFTEESIARMGMNAVKMCKQSASHFKDIANQLKSSCISDLYKLAGSFGMNDGAAEKYSLFKEACHCSGVLKNLDKVIPDTVKTASASFKNGSILDDRKIKNELKLAESIQNVYDTSRNYLEESKKYEKRAAALLNDFLSASGIQKKSEEKSLADLVHPDRSAFYKIARSNNNRRNTNNGQGNTNNINNSNQQNNQRNNQQNNQRNKDHNNKDKKPDNNRNILDFGLNGITKTYDFVSSPVSSKDVFDSLKDTAAAREAKDSIEQFRNVQRGALLTDLMINDPILADANPSDVANAYKAIVNMSPRMSLQKEVVRSILRQSVNSVAISPYDAKTWSDLEESIYDNQTAADRKQFDAKRK